MARATPILVFNAGSATLKYRLIDDGHDLVADIVEHIGEPGGPTDHGEAAGAAIVKLGDDERVHDHIRRLAAVGHRVVHRGDRWHVPTIVVDPGEATIEAFAPLAPAHTPAALAVIRAARRAYPDVPHVAVFDTAFHATLPAAASTYPLDRDVAATHGI